MKKILSALALVLTAALASGLSGGAGMAEGFKAGKIGSVPESGWTALSRSRIYFGHQSVGNNIMAGVADVMRERPSVGLSISETSSPEAFSGPVFAHSKVGENQKPLSKNEAFAGFMEDGIGGKADFAFYKFCYIDIKAGTDTEKLFNEYSRTLSVLKAKYPGTTFIHFTVPVTVVQSGWKASVKKALGRPIGGYADNIRRNEFNELLLRKYVGKEPVFDLAAVEATAPDGSRAGFNANGRTYMSLVPEYASDGRHLNEKGSKAVAEQLLVLLADLAAKRK